MAQCMSKALDKFLDPPAYPASRKSFADEMECYFAAMRDGKIDVPEAMVEALCIAAVQAVSSYMAKHEAMKYALTECAETGERMTDESEHHKRFKEVVDKMRSASIPNDIQKIIDEHFDGLTQEERQCLHQMAKAFSKKGNADAIRVSVDDWEKLKKNAESKLKKA